jgi:hypothetical protein
MASRPQVGHARAASTRTGTPIAPPSMAARSGYGADRPDSVGYDPRNVNMSLATQGGAQAYPQEPIAFPLPKV